MSEQQRIALRAPTGDVVNLATAPIGPKASSKARKTLRRLAQAKYGKPWHALWVQGYKVGKL